MQEYIMIGEIVRPQGVRGEVKARPITSDYRRFEGLKEAFLQEGDVYTPVTLKVRSVSPDSIILTVGETKDRDEAERLRGRFLFVDRAHTVELDEDSTLICDLIGLRGIDTEGTEIGTLKDVLQPAANDVYVFHGPRGEVLVPALKRVVKRVDLTAGTILMDAQALRETAVYDDEE